MIKFYKIFWLFLLIPFSSYLQADNETLVELRAAAFYHVDERFRRIYGRVSPNVQLEASTKTGYCIDLWFNMDYFSEFDKPRNHCGRTTIDLLTVSFGPKWVYPLDNCVDFYFGIGPSFAKAWLENRFSCRGVKEQYKKFGYGGVAKSGLYIYICPGIVMDIFADYFYQPFHFNGNLVKLGGFKTGVGLGKQF